MDSTNKGANVAMLMHALYTGTKVSVTDRYINTMPFFEEKAEGSIDKWCNSVLLVCMGIHEYHQAGTEQPNRSVWDSVQSKGFENGYSFPLSVKHLWQHKIQQFDPP